MFQLPRTFLKLLGRSILPLAIALTITRWHAELLAVPCLALVILIILTSGATLRRRLFACR